MASMYSIGVQAPAATAVIAALMRLPRRTVIATSAPALSAAAMLVAEGRVGAHQRSQAGRTGELVGGLQRVGDQTLGTPR